MELFTHWHLYRLKNFSENIVAPAILKWFRKTRLPTLVALNGVVHWLPIIRKCLKIVVLA